MKILHTSDWHLGRTLHGYNLIDDQKHMIKSMLEFSRENKVDLFIIAGDVYDKSQPNEEAVALFNEFLKQIILIDKIPTVIIAGNHDSNTRIHFGSDLFASQNLYIVGECDKGYEKIILHNKETIELFLIPYIEPAKVRELAGDEAIKRHDDGMRYIVSQIKKEMSQHASIAVAHAFVAGGDLSDSERRLCAVGTAEMVGADCFKDFTYTALGHLHKPQKIGSDSIRYSGSPLKYSISEANQPKGFTCITIEDDSLKEITQVPLIPKRELRIIEGPLEELIKIGTSLNEKQKNDYVYAKITTEGVQDVVGTLKQIYPYILGAEFVSEKSKGKHIEDTSDYETKKNKSIVELFEAFIDYVGNVEIDEEEQAYMHRILEDIEEARHETN